MGAACCTASRDRTIHHGSSGEILHRHSPSWSFRRDSRVGVAGEDTSVGWLSDVASRNDALDVKSTTDISGQVSDGGSSLESYQAGTWHKSPLNHVHHVAKNFRSSASDQSTSRNAPVEVKTESPQLHTASALSASPPSSQSNPLPPSPVPSRWGLSSGRNSPLEERQVPYALSIASNESTQGSYGRSSDCWSTHAFSDLVSPSQGEQWSIDSDSCSFTRVKRSRTSGRNSGALMSAEFQKCGICSKLLSEKSAWNSHIIVAVNELSVVSVLMCGHVYHAECLETITPEIHKYDPACPVCTFGEKQTLQLSGKLLKAEKDKNARKGKKSRNQAVDTNGSFDFDYWKSSPRDGKSPKLKTSSSLKISSAKPFLKRHFSFGSKSKKSALESPSIKMKGLFWPKSSRD
ncbi:hypothetical protein RND81_11G170200 [Saponaria officinalis]|uniref:RING-type domain-containing protein n=1 Tax=Saponaria officinalis TaxID=3572 RepID=A0AAW1HN66_SAPOF